MLAGPDRARLSEGLLLLLRIIQLLLLRLLLWPPLPCRLELRHQSLRVDPLGPPRQVLLLGHLEVVHEFGDLRAS